MTAPQRFPTAPQEFYHDAISDIEFRIRRLESQRPDMAQRAKAFDATTYANVGTAGGGAWVFGLVPATLSLTVTVPTDGSWLVPAWGEEVVQVDSTFGNAAGSTSHLTQFISALTLDGNQIDSHYGNAQLYDTLNWSKSSLIYGKAVQPARAIKVAAGNHTLAWTHSILYHDETTNVIYVRNRWLQCFVQA